MRRYANFFMKDFMKILGIDQFTKEDSVNLLERIGAHRGADRRYNEDEVRGIMTYYKERIKKAWRQIEDEKFYARQAARNADAERTRISKEPRQPIISDEPRKYTKSVDEPVSYMPDADPEKVSDELLRHDEVFYDDDNETVEDDRNILESLVSKYGKTDVLRYIGFVTSSK